MTAAEVDTERRIGCRANYCFSQRTHGDCVQCGRFTCERYVRIDPKTLRRRWAHECFDCHIFRPDQEQERLKEERTRQDWRLVTDPVMNGLIRPDEMPEQLPSTARAVLRAFFETPDVETAIVPDVSAATLNASIASLGLGEVMYAETRSQHTVLRRVATKPSIR